MKKCIKKISEKNLSPKTWLAILWLGGLFAALFLSLAVKLIFFLI